MAKILIGIHGLGNKPPKELLSSWWRKSIDEGLRHAGHPRLFYSFELVYWAQHLYPDPLNPAEKDKKHPLFLPEPYSPGKRFTQKAPSKWWRKTIDYLEKQLGKIFLNDDLSINFSAVSDYILRRYFRDLSIYYEIYPNSQDDSLLHARDRIRETLAAALEKHRRKEIMLIAHSMGSIVAYDVLTKITPHINIDTFVTIGSPLGLPVVVGKIIEEQKERLPFLKVETPENVLRRWYNFSDLNDKIAINYSLNDDYEANFRQVRAMDFIVFNNYEFNGKSNPHKDYGYLRTPELARAINEFWQSDRSRTRVWLAGKVNRVFSPYAPQSAETLAGAVNNIARGVKKELREKFAKKDKG